MSRKRSAQWDKVRKQRKSARTCVKHQYSNKQEADATAIRNSYRAGRVLGTYRCDQCGNWHITSKP